MKTILALIEGSEADAAILEAAHTLAKATDGHIDALHVDLTVLEAAGYAPQGDFARGSALEDVAQVARGAADKIGRSGARGLHHDMRPPRDFRIERAHRGERPLPLPGIAKVRPRSSI